MGRSAPSIAHELKNQARWRLIGEIDLDDDEHRWMNFSPPGSHFFVLADDFIGSGRTLRRLLADEEAPLPLLLSRHPKSEARILLVAGFEEGLRSVLKDAKQRCPGRIKIVLFRRFTEADTCFRESSRIIRAEDQRGRLQQFCVEVAERHFPSLSPSMRLGYAGLGALVVFYNTVPNTSLPILWHDTGTWVPLFPASDLVR